ncbi:hypothetical protein CBOM_07729 [Ceraceosorus bombacis]|uniref:Uncharacterized protein n=1 Tax=Ceraceosorus bombacis TaxID=401625 RepID=A0A0P1BHG5_9BASI|nr:hypothetical protein CBOM_07729 [Ceraceosorus bombacis]
MLLPVLGASQLRESNASVAFLARLLAVERLQNQLSVCRCLCPVPARAMRRHIVSHIGRVQMPADLRS